MRMLSLAALMTIGAALSAQAVEPMAPVQRQMFSCGEHAHMITHVAFIPQRSACCANGSGCAEALSTTILAKPHTRFRT